MKKYFYIMIIIFVISFMTVFVNAGTHTFKDISGSADNVEIGGSSDSVPNAITIYGGGTNAVSTRINNAGYTPSLEAPGYIILYAPNGDAGTSIAHYIWIDSLSKLHISSGSASGAMSGYGIPTDTGFDFESSGQLVGSQS